MSYRQDSLNRSRKIKLGLFYIIIAVLFYFASGFILSHSYGLLSFISTPLWRFEDNLKSAVKNSVFIFRSKESLQLENERLKNELEGLKLGNLSIRSLEDENRQLLNELGRLVPPDGTSVVSSVLSGPNIPPYEYLVIDAGLDMDVSVGDRVVYQPNIVVGEVEEVYSHSAKVKLYSASGVRTNILLPTEPPTQAIANGYGGGNFSIELPSSINLTEGMEVLIPGSDIYMLGVVDYIKVDPITSSQVVLIRYPMNIKNIRFVHVISMPVEQYVE